MLTFDAFSLRNVYVVLLWSSCARVRSVDNERTSSLSSILSSLSLAHSTANDATLLSLDRIIGTPAVGAPTGPLTINATFRNVELVDVRHETSSAELSGIDADDVRFVDLYCFVFFLFCAVTVAVFRLAKQSVAVLYRFVVRSTHA